MPPRRAPRSSASGRSTATTRSTTPRRPTAARLLGTLATLHTAPVHVRTHFLLNTGNGVASLKWGSTNIYTEDAAGNPIYNFTIIDGIMDAITGAGASPYAEIAFMPQAMTTAPAGVAYQNTGIYTLDGGCFYPPKDYTKWGALIRAWAMHVKTRYPGSDSGAESAWQWELWNEPDIGYWHGTPADYNKLYDYTESALHAVSPKAPLGGPSVAAPGSVPHAVPAALRDRRQRRHRPDRRRASTRSASTRRAAPRSSAATSR